jgi:hypothetical protein
MDREESREAMGIYVNVNNSLHPGRLVTWLVGSKRPSSLQSKGSSHRSDFTSSGLLILRSLLLKRELA